MWTTQPTHEGWHWWRRPYGKKILVTIVRVKKNFLEYKKKQVEAGKVPFSILQKVL